jgi:hypothetical protein
LSEKPVNGYVAWSISVRDEAAAENQLLHLLLDDPAVVVTEFGRQKDDLEDVFLKIVEGGQHGQS